MSKSKNMQIAKDLIQFIQHSPTPFHAVSTMKKMLLDTGFTELDEQQDWKCKKETAYFVTRNDSSLIAFCTGNDISNGFNMVGAHTDSPCLKIKPQPEIRKKGYIQLGVEVYGGVLLNPWFDRDLSIAGRISGVDKDGNLFNELIDFESPIAVVPSLAIHLNREANRNKSVNEQKEMPVLIAVNQDEFDFKQLLLEQSKNENAAEILDYELCCYDTQTPAIIGLNEEFISSARLDNLLSTYIGLKALIDSKNSKPALFVSTDHEEVGSASACGAQGPFLRSVLERLAGDNEKFTQTIARSTMISADNAHAIHPNYSDRHDQNHAPVLNQGPVIKVNSEQRYATTSVSAAKFKQLCAQNNVPVQSFVTRSDLGCGSTIGPITASEIGIETIDIGAPQLAMHSIRELAGTIDCEHLYQALKAFYTA